MSSISEVKLMQPFALPIVTFTRNKAPLINEAEYVKGLVRRQQTDISTSNDTYVLENENLKELKEFFEECIQVYITDIFKSPNKVDISQSWANSIKPNEYHAEHTHNGSLLSAVYYFEDTHQTPLNFVSPHDSYALYGFTINEYTDMNRSEFSVTCNPNELVIFPSFLRHKVPYNYTDKTRYNVVCNTQYKKGESYGMPGKVNTVCIK